MQIKRNVYSTINGGNNIYTSYGLARAFSRRMYSQLRFPHSVGNDMYSYLFALSHGLRFMHVPQAKAFYIVPTNYHESKGQSIRFYQGKRLMEKYFDHYFVSDLTRIPIKSLYVGIKTSLHLIIKKPIHTLAYLVYLLFTNMTSLHTTVGDRWEIATSSKHE